MNDRSLTLHPVEIPEWEAEDIAFGVLGDEPEALPDDEVRALLDEMTIRLPPEIRRAELVAYAREMDTPLGQGLQGGDFSYHLAEVPLNLLVPDKYAMVRLKLSLELEASDGAGAVAYDLFPPDQWDVGDVDLGGVDVDVSNLLTFVPHAAPLADCLGFKLSLPFKWKTRTVSVSTTDRMSNPVAWYVRDDAIQHGFVGCAIVRAPVGSAVTAHATVACELRRSGLAGRIRKRQFRSDRRSYVLSSDA